MFTRADINATINMPLEQKISLLHQPFTVQYSNDSSSEADCYFFRGSKKHYTHGVHFWLRSIDWLTDNWTGFQLLIAHRYPNAKTRVIFQTIDTYSLLDEYNLCKSISPESFQKAIEDHSLGLRHSNIPHTCQWEEQIEYAMQMSAEWNNQSWIAETESEFLIFYWETSA
jgi:hypothetical protein